MSYLEKLEEQRLRNLREAQLRELGKVVLFILVLIAVCLSLL